MAEEMSSQTQENSTLQVGQDAAKSYQQLPVNSVINYQCCSDKDTRPYTISLPNIPLDFSTIKVTGSYSCYQSPRFDSSLFSRQPQLIDVGPLPTSTYIAHNGLIMQNPSTVISTQNVFTTVNSVVIDSNSIPTSYTNCVTNYQPSAPIQMATTQNPQLSLTPANSIINYHLPSFEPVVSQSSTLPQSVQSLTPAFIQSPAQQCVAREITSVQRKVDLKNDKQSNIPNSDQKMNTPCQTQAPGDVKDKNLCNNIKKDNMVENILKKVVQSDCGTKVRSIYKNKAFPKGENHNLTCQLSTKKPKLIDNPLSEQQPKCSKSNKEKRESDKPSSPRQIQDEIILDDMFDENDDFPWLPCKDLPDHLKDENYMPQGEIHANCDSEPKMQDFDDHIIKFMTANKIPGLSLCISNRRSIVYTQCYGWASKDTLLNPSHMFRIASVSKILTAIAVLHLLEQKKLRLNTRIIGEKGVLCDLQPPKNGDRRWYNITVKHLLQHSGGWDRDIADDPIFYKHVGKELGVKEPVQPIALLQYMLSQRLQFTPGTKYVYSNFGYLILGLIIERVSGASYEKYVTSVLQQAGLHGFCLGKSKKNDKHSSEVDYFAGPRARQVDSVFQEDSGSKVDAPYGGISMETNPASGGWISTPTQLVRLCNALESGKILNTMTLRKMKSKPDFCKENSWYGMGLEVSCNGKEFQHSGHIDGSTCILTHSIEGFTWSVACNYWPADSDYNSLIQYGMCLIDGYTKLTPFITPQFDGATHLGIYAFSLNLKQSQFIEKSKFAFSEGYRIHWINAYTYQGSLLFNVIWVIDGKDGRFLYDIDLNNLDVAIVKQRTNGYCPTHLELYVKNNKVLCCVIFLKSRKQAQVVVYENPQLVEEQSKEMMLKGFAPSIVSICPINGLYKVAVIYHESPVRNWLKVNMTEDQYARKLSKQSYYGHMPTYVRVYKAPDKQPLFAAIWENPGPYLYTTNYDVSRLRLLWDFVQMESKGFLPHIIAGYESEGSQKYVGVFVKAVDIGSDGQSLK